MNEKQILNLPIEELKISVATQNCLKSAGINTLGDILNTSWLKLNSIKNLGYAKCISICKCLNDYYFDVFKNSLLAETVVGLKSFGYPKGNRIMEPIVDKLKQNTTHKILDEDDRIIKKLLKLKEIWNEDIENKVDSILNN